MKNLLLEIFLSLIILLLLPGKTQAAVGGNCPAACGQTASGHYVCTTRQICNAETAPGCITVPDCAWKDGCCSKCSESDCCGAPVGGGTACGGGGSSEAPWVAPSTDTGTDPACASRCGYAGCGCWVPPSDACGIAGGHEDNDCGPLDQSCCPGNECAYNGSDWFCRVAETCSYSGPPAPSLISPANAANLVYEDVTFSWSQPQRWVDGGGYWNNYQTCQDTNCHDNGCWIWDHWANSCYRSCDGRECQDHSDWVDRPDYYVDDFGWRSCTYRGSEYATGSFTVVVNGSSAATTSSHSLTVSADSDLLRPGNNSWYVVTTNSFGRSASSPTWTFNMEKKATVEGRVYYDPLSTAGLVTKCAGPVNQTIKPGGGTKVRVSPDSREAPVQGNGSYKVTRITEDNLKTISLGGMDPEYICTCPNGCSYQNVGVTIDGPNVWNFYVADVLPKWAQVLGGHVHGQRGARIQVPENQYLMVKSLLTNEPGAATKSGGGFDTSPGELSTTGWDLTDQLTQSTWRYGYQRLWIRAGSPTAEPGDGTNPPAAGIYRKSGDYTVGGGGWQNLSGSRVIFVDGDVTIRNKVTLAGASDFLAVIAGGDINVDPGVGRDALIPNPTPNQADLMGAFLANGDFSGGSTMDQRDKQLVIYGTVAADIDLDGVGRVNFQRDLGVGNRRTAGVNVIWNPNLILNFPDELKDGLTDWREVAP